VLVLLTLQNALKRIRVLHLNFNKCLFGLFDKVSARKLANLSKPFFFVKNSTKTVLVQATIAKITNCDLCNISLNAKTAHPLSGFGAPSL